MTKFAFVFTLFFAVQALASNVVLMIGDGMGFNHLKCANGDLFMQTLPVKGKVETKSFDNATTDSSAAATAYACGKKTNNGWLSILPDGNKCLTIAEEAVQKGYFVGIVSTDIRTGATPSAFYAHTKNRRGADEIEAQLKQAQKSMDIHVAIQNIEQETADILRAATRSGKPFFIMIEGANIDVESHKKNLKNVQKELKEFDNSIKLVHDFIEKNKDTTLIALADHETGGLTKACEFTTNKHTGADIPMFAYGAQSSLFDGTFDNTEIYKKMKKILFN